MQGQACARCVMTDSSSGGGGTAYDYRRPAPWWLTPTVPSSPVPIGQPGIPPTGPCGQGGSGNEQCVPTTRPEPYYSPRWKRAFNERFPHGNADVLLAETIEDAHAPQIVYWHQLRHWIRSRPATRVGSSPWTPRYASVPDANYYLPRFETAYTRRDPYHFYRQCAEQRRGCTSLDGVTYDDGVVYF